MRLTIKTPGDLSAFGIALSQNRIGWIALAIGAYLSGTLGLFRSITRGLMSALMNRLLSFRFVISTIGISLLHRHSLEGISIGRRSRNWRVDSQDRICSVTYRGSFGR